MSKRETFTTAFNEWDDTRPRAKGNFTPRLLLTADETGFHLRRVVVVEHDGHRDMMVYHCDKPLGTTDDLNELPELLRRAVEQLNAET